MTAIEPMREAEFHDRREAFYKELRRDMSKRFKGYEERSGEVYFNIAQASTLAESFLAEGAKQSGLTLAGLNVLMILSQHKPEGCPLNTISRLLVVSRANVTGLMDSLMRNGLVTRRDHATDRRIILASITPKGASLVASHLSKHYDVMHRLTAALTNKEKDMLIQILTKMRKGLLQLRDY